MCTLREACVLCVQLQFLSCCVFIVNLDRVCFCNNYYQYHFSEVISSSFILSFFFSPQLV